MAKQNSGVSSAAILTVGVDPNTTFNILEAADQMPWIVVSADFEAYVSATRRPHIMQDVKHADICIAVVDFDGDPDQAVESTRYLNQLFGGRLSVVALSQSQDPALLLLAMRSGCTEFIGKNFEPEDFIEMLQRLAQQRAGNATATRAAAAGSVLSFFGAKGGVGSTTLAVHLAMYLVEVHKKKTLLIDHHPELGHVCVYLGLDGTRFHFHELLRNVGRLDSDLLHGFTAKHASGLEVLSSPDVCGSAREFDPEAITKLLEFLRTEYDYVIMDCSTSLSESNLAVIDGSAQVYLVATPEISAIRDLSRYVDSLANVKDTTEKIQVVINRFSSQYAVSVEQIEKAIRLPVAMRLPNSYLELVRSVNLGEPVSPKRKSEFSGQFVKWSNSLAGVTTAANGVAKPETKELATQTPKSFLSFLMKQPKQA